MGLAENPGQIDCSEASVDGSFPPGQGVLHGDQGKGVTIHNLVDVRACPYITQTAANDDERQQVSPWLQAW